MNVIFKKFLLTISVIASLLLTVSSNAQQRFCGSEEVLKKQIAEDPHFQQIREEIEKHSEEFKNRASNRGGMLEITIPVVVHVVHFNEVQNVSDNQIIAQIEVLNNDFRRTNSDATNTPIEFQGVAADCEINFCLAKQDPLGNPTTGIERRLTSVNGFASSGTDAVKFFAQGGLDAWDRDRYLNIWVCNVFDSDYIAYARFPGGNAARDGIICDFAYFGTENAIYKGRVMTHEVGHWLNCYHIWGDEDGCNGTDNVDDTPNQASANYGCPTFPSKSCNNGPNGDIFMNYMDYTDGSCMNLFTSGQKTRMQALFAQGGARASLAQSYCENACSNPYWTTEIFENTIYNIDNVMPGNIVVHTGAELRIEATIGMRPGTRIFIERNARLFVGSSGTLTAECQDWLGIQVIGNNQKVQPEFDAPLNDPAQAGIVWVDGGIIEWARIGITTGGGFGPESWGGVIRTSNNAIFQNNRKDVEFMSYKFSPNKSRFINTTFIEIGDAFLNTEGVTIWETDGIEFINCTFKNKDREGIFTYDAGVKVLNSNQFENNKTGINAYATYPMTGNIQIGSGSEIENTFINNEFHIIASSISEITSPNFSLDIVNNNFTSGKQGITIGGSSNFRVAGNLLANFSVAGNVVFNTGFNNLTNQNFIVCNTIRSSPRYGIVAVGENKELQFLANDFQMGTGGTDFVLTRADSPPLNGSIRATQGNQDQPAFNCFTAWQDDIWTYISTDPFKYYYEGGGEPLPDCESEPINFGNYTTQNVPQPQSVIDCDQFGGLPEGLTDPTSGDLNTRRTTLQQLAPYITTNENALNLYYKTLQEKDAILRYLVKQSLSSGQYATAEGLLAGEQSKAADWAIFGLRMGRSDYANAALWLNQLPIQDDEDAKFRGVQLINIQRLQNLDSFQLSVGQEAYLTSVAESNSPVRGYARGILSLLKDMRFYPDEIELDSVGQEVYLRKSSENTQNTLLLSPVPAMSALSVSWPSLPIESDARLLIYDIFGKQQISAPITSEQSQLTLEVSQLPIGVYFLVIYDRGKPLHQAKFSIQR